MISNSQCRLWRVDWVHRDGYLAPYQVCECRTKKEAAEWAKKSSRLADFPHVWCFRLSEIIKEEKLQVKKKKT
jgi:hypothetical protein